MKTLYCTLDTETLGGAARPQGIYDLGGVIHDREGNVYGSFHFLIAEHFEAILEKAFYGKKNFDRYQRMIEVGDCSIIPTEEEAIAVVDSILNHYNVKYLMAFNTGFDLIKTACRELVENREFIDIQLMAAEIFGGRKSYSDFCHANGMRGGGKGTRCAATAETYYAFITNNPDYEEEHTAFEDSLIEMAIFTRCIKAHKKFTRNSHNYDCRGWSKIVKW